MKKGGRILGVFALVWAGMVLLFDGLVGRGIYQQWRSRSFVPVEGRVLSSEVVKDTGSDSTTYRARVRYEYFLSGQRYESDVVRFGDMATSYGRSARATVQANPAGVQRTIYYDAARPAEAVLERGVSDQQVYILVFLTAFNAAMVFLLGLGWSLQRRTPHAGGAVIRPVGRELHVNFKRFTRITAAAGIFGGIGFVGSLVLGFSWKMEPPVNASLSVWAVGAVLTAFVLLRSSGATPDLIVDPVQGVVSLRHAPFDGFGGWRAWRRAGKPRAVIPFLALGSIEVQERISKSSDGDSRAYVPVLVTKSDTGNAIVHELGSWIVAEHAEAFAAWLRETLGLGETARAKN